MEGDGPVREKWLKEWGIDTSTADQAETILLYEETSARLKEILGLQRDADTEKVLGAAKGIVDRNAVLEKELKPRVIYKYQGKDYEKAFKFSNLVLIIEKAG